MKQWINPILVGILAGLAAGGILFEQIGLLIAVPILAMLLVVVVFPRTTNA